MGSRRWRPASPRSTRTQAARTDLRNPRRVLRALERATAGGGPVTAADRARTRAASGWSACDAARPVLVARIEARARRIFAAGLLDEVARLRGGLSAPSWRRMSGHGYREAAADLAGEWTREGRGGTVRAHASVRQRQMTWFRAEPRIVWLAAGEREANDAALVERAAELLRRLLLA